MNRVRRIHTYTCYLRWRILPPRHRICLQNLAAIGQALVKLVEKGGRGSSIIQWVPNATAWVGMWQYVAGNMEVDCRVIRARGSKENDMIFGGPILSNGYHFHDSVVRWTAWRQVGTPTRKRDALSPRPSGICVPRLRGKGPSWFVSPVSWKQVVYAVDEGEIKDDR